MSVSDFLKLLNFRHANPLQVYLETESGRLPVINIVDTQSRDGARGQRKNAPRMLWAHVREPNGHIAFYYVNPWTKLCA